MAQMLFYDNVTPLNRNEHQQYRVRTDQRDFAFARRAHFVPLIGVEFVQAARDLPILFTVGEQAAGAIALLGIGEGRNVFVSADGAWAEGVYVPAFVRRYPFVLARGGETGGSDGDEERMTVCFDASWSGIGEGGDGEALFTADGEQSEYLTRQVAFLQEYRAASARTETGVRRLHELGLLIPREIQLTGSAGSHVLRDFHVVDDHRLAALDGETAAELHSAGYLQWCHAHQVSMGNLAPLQRRAGA